MIREGWVSVADASKALTAMGDAIDASNVSKYLLRNADIPQERVGKFRYVELSALILHRGGNFQSVSRREVTEGARPAIDEDAEEASLPPGIASEIQQATLRIKQLEVRKREREDALEVGDLVPAEQVLTVINYALATFVSELERAEVSIAGLHGRVVAADFRRARKDAQRSASTKLAQTAKAEMHAKVAEQVVNHHRDPD